MAELSAYVNAFLGLKVPGKRMCEGHSSPLDYLAYVLLDGTREEKGEGHRGDVVVWANRGGGKTSLGAVASLLECLFLPGCSVRILGGSQEQSQRMYEYLRQALEPGYANQVVGRVTDKGCRFVNGANVQVLAQSHRSVRGHHVQRLRCDEVELFDRNVWQAAQFVTQSSKGIDAHMEVLSTMHRPFGLMREILDGAETGGAKVFRWCLWEVIERCVGRDCNSCCLWEDCGGRAKEAEGYYGIDDAIAQKQRSSKQAWRSEMLCLEPSREDVVFGEFSMGRHVRELAYDANLPLYRSIDFGFSNPLACLFIQVDERGRVLVLDEHIKSRTTLAEHARLIKERYPYKVEATYCDPAGKQKHEITGTAAVGELAALGIPTRCRRSGVLEGVEIVRSFLAPATGEARLLISPRCEQLIRAFGGLEYARLANGALSEQPAKDGVHDHVIDALRYFFVNRFGRSHGLREKRY